MCILNLFLDRILEGSVYSDRNQMLRIFINDLRINFFDMITYPLGGEAQSDGQQQGKDDLGKHLK